MDYCSTTGKRKNNICFDFEVKCPFKDLHLQQEPAIVELRATDGKGGINALKSRLFWGVFMEFFDRNTYVYATTSALSSTFMTEVNYMLSRVNHRGPADSDGCDELTLTPL